MRLATILMAATAALSLGGPARAASVEIKDAVARVTVIPEARGDVKVEVIAANPRLPLQVRVVRGRTIIDGRLDRRIRGCDGTGQAVVAHVLRLGDVAWRDMPQVVVRTPRDVDIDTGGAIWGSIGRSASLSLGNAGCGGWTVGNVAGAMRISQAGSGDTRTGSAGSAKIRVAGSGDIRATDIRGGLEVDVAGSGDVTVASLSGPLEVHVAGSGDVRVDAGRATSMDVALMGSGDVSFGGVAGSLKARIAGSGDVRAHAVRGPVAKTVVGSGRVRIGD